MTAHYGLPSPTALAARRCIRIFWLQAKQRTNAVRQLFRTNEMGGTLVKPADACVSPQHLPWIGFDRSVARCSTMDDKWALRTANRTPGADLVCMRQLIKAGYNVRIDRVHPGIHVLLHGLAKDRGHLLHTRD